MDKLHATLTMLLYMLFGIVEIVSAEIAEQRVQPGDIIILECNSETEVTLIEWRRNCSHVNQPPFAISDRYAPLRYSITTSTKSSVLRIENITEDDLGFYYCVGGASKREPFDKTFEVIFEDTSPHPTPTSCPPPDCGHYWILLISLCPVSVLLCIISSTCVYCLTRDKKESTNKEIYSTILGIEDTTTTVVYRNMK